jgi:hypothetical protein
MLIEPKNKKIGARLLTIKHPETFLAQSASFFTPDFILIQHGCRGVAAVNVGVHINLLTRLRAITQVVCPGNLISSS